MTIYVLQKLNLQTLHFKRRQSEALFLINVFSGAKYYPLYLLNSRHCVPTRT
jgi:hypothetical protein